MPEPAESPTHGFPEPLAVIGMACRFAGGADSPEVFWTMLTDGRDAISEITEERWEEYRNASAENTSVLSDTTRFGGFLPDIKGFDAEFFGVLPREAELMDPQQRIMLEVVWEALEHAGIPPTTLAGTDTGVFIGVGSDDYGRRLLEDLPGIEAWTGIGAAMCAVANRVSYSLDLRGSSFAVDTACSSSLVALHLAGQALAAREIPLAVVGGVNVMAGPGLTMVLDAAGAISPDGRCKSFDAHANGYGRGEGAGVLVVKRLADARRDGDRVLSVIRGSAVNQDGRTNGIMAPSAEAQTHLLRQAYRVTGVDPLSVDYVEAHGTGTRAGDPVEAQALAAVFGEGRDPERPCLIGSVKPNIGHLEAGSGVAGVIKATLALQHAELPPSLNFTEPNPAVPWDTAGLRVVTERQPWPTADGPRRAGVSGYGYGGTIAHVILEQAPQPIAHRTAGTDVMPSQARVFPLSAATGAGLRGNAERLAGWLAEPGRLGSLDAVGHTLASHRSHLPQRAAVVARDRDELIELLRRTAAGDEPAGVATGTPVAGATAGVVWVFSGHGSQWLGMGRELLAAEPVFADALAEIAPVFAAELGWTPQEVLLGDTLTDVDVIQPMIFAMQVGLSEVWRTRGVTPAAVIGHSVGEIAAAYCVGALDLHDAAQLVCRRSVLLRRVAGRGAMAMVDLPFETVVESIDGASDITAAIAAAPGSTVVAGTPHAVDDVCAAWAAEGRLVRRVASDVAFHSPQMEPLLDDLITAAADITPREPKVPLYSTALTDPRSRVVRDGHYWAANLRNPVRFADAVRAAVADGYRVFLEVSSHPVVAHSIAEVLADADILDGVVTGTLRRGRPEQLTLLSNLGLLHCSGVPIAVGDQFPDGDLVDLPRYAWQHREFWRASTRSSGTSVQRHDVADRTLLGGLTTVAGTRPLRLWQTTLDHGSRPYPGDHPVQGTEIIPAAVLLNTFFAAAGRPALVDVALRVPVSVAARRDIQVSSQDGMLRLASRPVGESSWLTHTIAAIDPTSTVSDAMLDAAGCRRRCPESLPVEFVIDRLASIGVAAMGFPWRIEELRRAEGVELLATVTAGGDGPEWTSVLDATLSIASVAFAGPPTLRMPAAIGRVSITGDCPDRVLIVATVADATASADTVDVRITTLDGRVVGEFDRLRYGVLDGDPGAAVSPQRLVHELVWRPANVRVGGDLDAVAVVTGGHSGPVVDAITEALRTCGVTCQVVADVTGLSEIDFHGAVLVVPPDDSSPIDAGWLLAATAQDLVRQGGASRTLWAVTTGVRESQSPSALWHAPIWGLGRIIGGEHPELWGGVIDLAEADTAGAAAQLHEVLRAGPGEDVLSLDSNTVECARLVPAERAAAVGRTPCRLDGTYLVTGGLGVLGMQTARWLAGRGARRIMLAGRRGLPERKQWAGVTDPTTAKQIDDIRALETLGVTIVPVAVDIADPAAARRALDPARYGLPPVRGVVHAAGVLDNRMLVDLDRDSLSAVMSPKVDGALTLHKLFPPGALDFLVLFSSCGYLFGLPGQASYGSANAFLDAFAVHRRALGDNTVSLAWTSWRGLGMSTSSVLIDLELNARGTADITMSDAFGSWEYSDGCAGGHLAVFRPIPIEAGMTRPRVLDEVTVDEPEPEPEAVDEDAKWTQLPPAELRDRLVAEVCVQVANEIRLAPDELDLDRPLPEMGMDSVMTLVIRRRLEKIFRLSLPSTLLWNHPTVTAIAHYLFTELTGGAEGDAAVLAEAVGA